MKDFKGLQLCNWYSDRVDVHVRASVQNGALTIEGHDLGPYVEEVWGDSDYEYWYQFDPENTEKLFRVIHGEEDPEGALLRKFSGEGGCRRLRKVCMDHDIVFSFFSYA